jgi:phosphoribosyl 1,2-cyclic phosphate phosphodiesterase
MTTRVTILGCGGSLAVPMAGNEWLSCDPAEPRNRRTRPSILIEQGGNALVIDTGPDFYEQTNRCNIKRIDAVLYTHYHADHTLGMDDLRGWCRRRNITMPVYATDETFADLKARFDYLLVTPSNEALYPIVLNTHILGPAELYTPMKLGGVGVTLFEQDHGSCTSLGVRIGNFAYSTDMLRLPERSIRVLQGVENWVVDGAAYNNPETVHAGLSTVYALNERVGATNVYITHMPAYMDYQTLCRELPKGYAPAYDGLTFAVTA